MHYSDFAYISGLIRILEQRLIKQNDMDRLVDARNITDSFRVLNDLDYAKFMDKAKSPEQFQNVLDAEILDVKQLLEKHTPHHWFLNIFWYQYDIHNIKTLLKASLLGKKYDEISHLLSKLGSIDIKFLKSYILDGKMETEWGNRHEKEFKLAITKAHQEFAAKNNPKFADYIIDSLYLSLALRIAKRTRSSFLCLLVQHLIDLSNIKMYLRFTKWEEGNIENRAHFFQSGGLLPVDKFSLIKDEWLREIEKSPYSAIVKNSITDIERFDSFIRLENECENFISFFIRSYRFTALGPEVVVNYLLAKKNNAAILRMIFVSKLSQIPIDEIKKNLRKLFSLVDAPIVS